MAIYSISQTIRAKKLGALIRNARLVRQKTLEECAQAIGVTDATLEAYEFGESSPSLPEIEILAYYLQVPLEQFWGDKALDAGYGSSRLINQDQLLGIRQRKIGAFIRQARLEADLSPEALAENTMITADVLESYELGELPVPLPILENLCKRLNRSIKEFQDQRSPQGAWAAQQSLAQDFQALPPELQTFISKAVNRPYLEVALRLSEMSVEKIRAIAETLLEITY